MKFQCCLLLFVVLNLHMGVVFGQGASPHDQIQSLASVVNRLETELENKAQMVKSGKMQKPQLTRYLEDDYSRQLRDVKIKLKSLSGNTPPAELPNFNFLSEAVDLKLKISEQLIALGHLPGDQTHLTQLRTLQAQLADLNQRIQTQVGVPAVKQIHQEAFTLLFSKPCQIANFLKPDYKMATVPAPGDFICHVDGDKMSCKRGSSAPNQTRLIYEIAEDQGNKFAFRSSDRVELFSVDKIKKTAIYGRQVQQTMQTCVGEYMTQTEVLNMLDHDLEAMKSARDKKPGKKSEK